MKKTVKRLKAVMKSKSEATSEKHATQQRIMKLNRVANRNIRSVIVTDLILTRFLNLLTIKGLKIITLT
jgi:hypothetical protein